MIAKILYDIQRRLREKAKAIGLRRLKVRSPAEPPFFPEEAQQSALYLVAQSDQKSFKPLKISWLTRWLKKRLKRKQLTLSVFIETQSTIDAVSAQSIAMKQHYKALSSSSVLLKKLKKDAPLSAQWKEQFERHTKKHERKCHVELQNMLSSPSSCLEKRALEALIISNKNLSVRA